jgi:hypothetical protein
LPRRKVSRSRCREGHDVKAASGTGLQPVSRFHPTRRTIPLIRAATVARAITGAYK